ncbi:MAG TPA: hypothetical protein VGJ05_13805, partial [Fimbriiglobus sp.]
MFEFVDMAGRTSSVHVVEPSEFRYRVANSVQIIDKYSCRAKNGPAYRTPTAGPELNLVAEYVRSRLPSPPRGQALTVFLEPEIESGFPDAVAVYWLVSTAQRWSPERTRLTPIDIRIAHFLATMGRSTRDFLCNFFFSGLGKSLERLVTAGMVRRSGQYWLLRPLHCIYAVRRLVAIEAKVSHWRGGLMQAAQNRWFASESYLLLPEMPKQFCRNEIEDLG